MGTVTSLDFSLPDAESESGKIDWPGVMRRILPVTDIFVPSLEEVLQIMMLPNIPKYCPHPEPAILSILFPHPDPGNRQNHNRQRSESSSDKGAHRGVYLMTGDVSSINEKPGSTCLKKKEFQGTLCDSYPRIVRKS